MVGCGPLGCSRSTGLTSSCEPSAAEGRSALRRSMWSVQLWLRRLSGELTKLLGRTRSHRRSPMIAQGVKRSDKFYHRVAVRHFECRNRVILAGGYVSRKHLSTDLFGQVPCRIGSLRGLCWRLFPFLLPL